MALAGVGGIAWFLTSPYMSVNEVFLQGVSRSGVEEILARHQVVAGRPMVAIQVGSVEEGLVTDPWVASASVKLVFPTRVEVHVQERMAVAWMPFGGRWALLADDGVILEYSDNPTPSGSVIRIPADDPGLGSVVSVPTVSGALQFLSALPEELAKETTVRASGDELWVRVASRTVRLGMPVDIDSKAASLLAIIKLAPEGIIDVSAPGRPAIRTWDTIEPAVRRRMDL